MSNSFKTLTQYVSRYFAYRSQPAWYQRMGHFLIAIVLMGLSLWIRLLIAPVEAGLQYVAFFPVVALSAVIGGVWPGLFAALLGIGVATYVFTPPYYSFSTEALQASLWPNLVFLGDGFIVCFSIESMHRFRRRYAAELKEAQEAMAHVQAINRELDEFTYIASHDLKEPLRGIHNYASFLKEDCADQMNNEAKDYVERIQRLAERMSLLIDRLLAYSRLGSKALVKTKVDVDDIVDSLEGDVEHLWVEGCELRRNGHLGLVNGDAVRIGEVFQNLICNAFKYNDKPLKWAEVGRDDSGPCPVFYVRDNGIGIPPQHHDNVFRIFKRLHEQNKYGGGTGAGLTIVKKIVERHGGHIWLESVPGVGTTFYFTLNSGAA